MLYSTPSDRKRCDYFRHIHIFAVHQRTDSFCASHAARALIRIPFRALMARPFLASVMVKSTLLIVEQASKIDMFARPFRVKVAVTLCLAAVSTFAQDANRPASRSLEVSEVDGIPVLVKHLPDWEAVRPTTVFARSTAELRASLGERPVLDLIDWTAGTEAVTAAYPAGRLLIVEFTSPQGSAEADAKFGSFLAGDGSTAYRRIGNYNAMVMDVSDRAQAEALLDQVRYEKQIQWLGNNPFRISAERAFVLTTTDIFMSTVIVIMIGIVVSLIGGVIVGFVYFRFSQKRRAHLTTFSDAGGMTRLNLDGFTPEVVGVELLKD